MTDSEHMFRIHLAKGETVFIFAEGTSPSFVIEPQPEDPATSHAWGLH